MHDVVFTNWTPNTVITFFKSLCSYFFQIQCKNLSQATELCQPITLSVYHSAHRYWPSTCCTREGATRLFTLENGKQRPLSSQKRNYEIIEKTLVTCVHSVQQCNGSYLKNLSITTLKFLKFCPHMTHDRQNLKKKSKRGRCSRKKKKEEAPSMPVFYSLELKSIPKLYIKIHAQCHPNKKYWLTLRVIWNW